MPLKNHKNSENLQSHISQGVDFYSKKFPQYNLHCWTNELVSEADKDVINTIVLRKNVKVVLTDFKYNFLKTK